MTPQNDRLTRSRNKAGMQASLAAQTAYDLFADRYDHWSWQEFWHQNEWPLVETLVATARRRATILDVGTGTGFYLSQLLNNSRMICGIDLSYQMLRIAHKRVGKGAFLVQANATLIPFC